MLNENLPANRRGINKRIGSALTSSDVHAASTRGVSLAPGHGNRDSPLRSSDAEILCFYFSRRLPGWFDAPPAALPAGCRLRAGRPEQRQLRVLPAAVWSSVKATTRLHPRISAERQPAGITRQAQIKPLLKAQLWDESGETEAANLP